LVKTVYLDVLFLINFILNYLILLICAKVSSVHINRVRIALAAFTGAVYAAGVFFLSLSFLHMAVSRLIVAAIMVLIAFSFYTLRRVLKLFFIFMGITLAFGGGIFAIYFVTNLGAQVQNGIFYINLPFNLLFFGTVVTYAIISIAFRKNPSLDLKSGVYTAEISIFGSTIRLQALLDTGNKLRDPLSNKPVVIAEYSAIREALPFEIRAILDNTNRLNYLSAIERIPRRFKIRLVPFRTVRDETDMFLAFSADCVSIEKTKMTNVLIAVNPEKISDDEEYSALVGLWAV